MKNQWLRNNENLTVAKFDIESSNIFPAVSLVGSREMEIIKPMYNSFLGGSSYQSIMYELVPTFLAYAIEKKKDL